MSFFLCKAQAFLCGRFLFYAITASPTHKQYFVQNASKFLPLRYFSIKGTESFTVNYLINACGFSPKSALAASQLVHLKTPEKPDMVIALFKNFGFSQIQISRIIKLPPRLLLSKPEKTILPKVKFFLSRRFSNSDIITIVSGSPMVLHRSLKNQIIPYFDLLKNLLQSDEKIVAFMKRGHYFYSRIVLSEMFRKIKLLRDNGVPESRIAILLYHWPETFIINFDKFKMAVEQAMKLGFDPSKYRFVRAIAALKGMRKLTWERKIELYKRWNLSMEEILEAIRRDPVFLIKSEDKIVKVMDIFVNKLGWGPSAIVKRPSLLSFSLKKRIIPRASVLQFLVSKGLVKKDFRVAKFFECSEKQFLQNFMNRYAEAPQLLRLYGEKQQEAGLLK